MKRWHHDNSTRHGDAYQEESKRVHNKELIRELHGLNYNGEYGSRTSQEDGLVALHDNVTDQKRLVKRKQDTVKSLKIQLATVNDLVTSVFGALDKDAHAFLADSGMDHNTIEELRHLAGPSTMLGAMQQHWLQNLGKSRTTMAYPPMLIHFALLVHNTSPSAARKVRACFPLMFPSEATLRRANNTKAASSGVGEDALKLAWELSHGPHVKKEDRFGTLENDDVSIQEVPVA